MRFTDFRVLTEQQLDELRMSPSSLKSFINSPEAEGIRAGFEAELIFQNLGASDDDYDELEPDMDMDERAYSIEDVVAFFSNDEWGYGLSQRGERDLRNGLDEMYMEWYDEQVYDAFRDEAVDLIRQVIEDEDWDWDESTREALEGMGLSEEEVDAAMEAGESAPRYTKLSDQTAAREASKAYDNYLEARDTAEEMLSTQADNSYQDQDGFYDTALEQFRDDFQPDDSDFFSDVGLRWMSDVRDQFDLDWPYMRGGDGGDDGFSESNAEMLADDLHEKLGFKTKVSSGYHSARRDDVTWIFEPDSSLDADSGDMPVEIVSPPMPIKEALINMRKFFKWAIENGAYSNSSTGFHMGVSLPYAGGNVDFVKLALFLGDEYVLKEFGRSANHFTEAAMKKIRASISRGNAKVGDAMELMRGNLIELASRSVSKGNFGKYTSINPHDGYIEFRSAGGENYIDDIERLENIMMRYAQAMHVASRADLERKEYAKKLYKLIAPEKGDASLELFAKYTAGTISKEDLKKQWAELALEKDAPDLLKKSTWQLFDKITGKPVTGHQYGNYTYDDAMASAKSKISPGSSVQDFKKHYEMVDTSANTGKWAVVDINSHDVIDVITSDTRGEAVDQAMEKYSSTDIKYYVRPYVEFDQVSKPLSRRAELAKRIKSPKAQDSTGDAPRNDYELYRHDTPNQVFHTLRNVTADEVRDFINKQEQEGMPPGFLRVRQAGDQSANLNPANYNGRWEVLNPNGELIRHVQGNLDDAENARRQVMFRYENPTDVTVRPAPN